jgi:hypothetical protein
MIVRLAIDLDRKLGCRAIEVEHVRPKGVLTSNSNFRATQAAPQQHFRR